MKLEDDIYNQVYSVTRAKLVVKVINKIEDSHNLLKHSVFYKLWELKNNIDYAVKHHQILEKVKEIKNG